jgi:hypothetical protein
VRQVILICVALAGLLLACGGDDSGTSAKAACGDLHTLGQNIGTYTVAQIAHQATTFNKSAQDSGNANLAGVSFQLKQAADAVEAPADQPPFTPLRDALQSAEALCVKLGYP